MLLDFDTVRNGRGWHDWPQWFEAMNIRGLKASGSLRFSHYDQVVQAAIEGSGVAIGKRPHLARFLREGTLVAMLGDEGIARLGSFYVVVSGRAPRPVAEAFVSWLHDEAQQDARIVQRAATRFRGQSRTRRKLREQTTKVKDYPAVLVVGP